MTELELLNDTANHYNSGNRCVIPKQCKYSPVTLKLVGKSEGCAIGRHMTPENALAFDKERLIGIDNLNLNVAETYCNFSSDEKTKFLAMLPDWMRKMNIDFLSDIQNLHDLNGYWNENGLTEAGKKRVTNIKIKYNL